MNKNIELRKETLTQLIEFSEEILRKNYDSRDKMGVISLLIRGISPFKNSEIINADINLNKWNELIKKLAII